MTAAIFPEPVLESGVREFLQRHSAEADFFQVLEFVRGCFPESRTVRAGLIEDPDEENHTWVMLEVTIPASCSPDTIRAQRNNFHQRLAQEIVRSYHPLSFSLAVRRAEG